jgi:putative transcriptional regulator
MAMENLLGSLLIANGNLMDPNFRRTVIVVTEHSEEGAMGLVLNRPANVTVEEAAPTLSDLVPAGSLIYVGGPVQPEAAIVLADLATFDVESKIVIGTIGMLAGFDGVANGIKRARVFAGYAGWGPGQLESEAEEDAWIIEDALPADIFTDEPERLWSRVLQRKGGEYRLLALMPLDPSTN